MIIPCIDNYTCVDLRTISFMFHHKYIIFTNLKKQILIFEYIRFCQKIQRLTVDAVVYYHICDATAAVCNVEDFTNSTRLLATTTLRNILATRNFAEMLSDRESISDVMQSTLDEATNEWGVKVERIPYNLSAANSERQIQRKQIQRSVYFAHTK